MAPKKQACFQPTTPRTVLTSHWFYRLRLFREGMLRNPRIQLPFNKILKGLHHLPPSLLVGRHELSWWPSLYRIHTMAIPFIRNRNKPQTLEPRKRWSGNFAKILCASNPTLLSVWWPVSRSFKWACSTAHPKGTRRIPREVFWTILFSTASLL